MLDSIGQSLIQDPDHLDDVPWPKLGMNRQALRRRPPIQRDAMRTQLRRGAVAPRAQRQHQIAANVIHGIDDQAEILQRRPRRVADARAGVAPFA